MGWAAVSVLKKGTKSMNESELQATEIHEEMARHFECLLDLNADMATRGVTFGSGDYKPSEKTCDTCKYYKHLYSWPGQERCDLGVTILHPLTGPTKNLPPDFGCNKWESKV